MDYADYMKSAVAVKGYQADNGVLHMTRTVRDIDNDCSRSYFTPYTVTPTSIEPLCPPIEVVKCDLQATSPSGRNIVRVSMVDEKCILEIMRGGSLVMRIDASDMHEKAIGDNWFGGYNFSHDETQLVYVAGTCVLCLRQSAK